MQFSTPENLVKAASSVLIDATAGTDNRVRVLALTIISAAGHLIGDFLRNEEVFCEDIRQYFRDTNPDVITAEAIVWMAFLMGQFWKADQKNDHEMFERVSYTTISTAGKLALEMIKSNTGFDFTERAIESRKQYLQSAKNGTLVEAFASVLFLSVGRRSLAEPLKPARPPLDLVWGTINMVLSIFFSTMPLAYYETFKNMLRDRPDLFPHDDEDDLDNQL